MADSNTLDLQRFSTEAAIDHHTQVKVVTGAVAVSVTPPGGSGETTLMMESMSEPQERTIGGAAPVEVLHVPHPIEWVVPAYDGGTFTLNLHETWENNPYEEAGFAGMDEFIDIINHVEFTTSIFTFRPNGKTRIQQCVGCRITGPIIPSGPLARSTTNRIMPVPVGYVRMRHIKR